MTWHYLYIIKSTVGAKASVWQNCTFIEYTRASKRKKQLATDCGQDKSASRNMISTGTKKKYKLQLSYKNLAIATKYNLATIINKLGMNMKNNIHKVR